MPSLLVTGGAGFIGANFVLYWLAEHPGQRLTIVDALTYAGNLSNLESVKHRRELRFVHGSVCDTRLIERILRDDQIDTIVHFAAESHVDRSINGPDAFIEANIIGTHSLLKAARRVWLEELAVERHRFHHVSTDEVFGALGVHDRKFHERTPYAPNSPYAATKAASDHLVRAYHRTYGLQATISFCTNNYGPFQYPEKLIPLTITSIVYGRPIGIYGEGRNVRDWIHVVDHCQAIDLILERGTSGETYNIGCEAECENVNLVGWLCEIADEVFRSSMDLRSRYPRCPAARGASTRALIQFVADRPGHDFRYATDCTRIIRELGYRARIPLDVGLRETFMWYLKNEAWLQRDTVDNHFDWHRSSLPIGKLSQEQQADLFL